MPSQFKMVLEATAHASILDKMMYGREPSLSTKRWGAEREQVARRGTTRPGLAAAARDLWTMGASTKGKAWNLARTIARYMPRAFMEN